jgi:voltage-gated potassium channel
VKQLANESFVSCARSSSALYFVIFVGMTVLEFVGLLELWFEEDAPDANITTAGDALWWGYGDGAYGDQFR